MIVRLEFRIFGHRYGLEHDRDYGIDRRTGWSVKRDGSYAVQLEPWLIVAILRAIRSIRDWE